MPRRRTPRRVPTASKLPREWESSRCCGEPTHARVGWHLRSTKRLFRFRLSAERTRPDIGTHNAPEELSKTPHVGAAGETGRRPCCKSTGENFSAQAQSCFL